MSGSADQVFDEIHEEKEELLHPSNSTPQTPNPPLHSLTFRHFNALAVMIVFSAIGMISVEDISFVVFSFFYVLFLSKFVFPPLTQTTEPPVFKSRLLGYYVLFAAFVGLLFPFAYILEGIYGGDKERIEAAVPHLFLLSSQVFMEGITFSGRFPLPIRAFVPICYNTRRIFSIVDWLRSEFGEVGGELGSGRRLRLHVGKGLAIANLVLWSYNLFGFLLPVYLPIVFKRYYGHKAKG